MTFDENISLNRRFTLASFFNGFEPKSLLVGTVLFYLVSGLMALGYIALDHPSLGLRIFAQQQQLPVTSQSSAKALPITQTEFSMVYTSLAKDPSLEMKRMADVLAQFDLRGIDTRMQCHSQHCLVTMKSLDTGKQQLIADVKIALNQ